MKYLIATHSPCDKNCTVLESFSNIKDCLKSYKLMQKLSPRNKFDLMIKKEKGSPREMNLLEVNKKNY